MIQCKGFLELPTHHVYIYIKHTPCKLGVADLIMALQVFGGDCKQKTLAIVETLNQNSTTSICSYKKVVLNI